MPRTRAATQALAQALDSHVAAAVAAIHLLGVGCEYQINTFLAQQRTVLFQIARIAAEIFLGAKLERVDENGNGDHVAVSAGRAYQGEVPGVQRAHRRNQAQALARPPHLTAGGVHFVNGGEESQELATEARSHRGIKVYWL